MYVFSSSGQLGITRTAKLQRSDGVSVRNYGVLGIDFELVGLSQIIADSVAGMGSWAYVVETGGANAGLLVGTTFRASLRDEISGDRCFAHGICGNDRTIQSESIAATATKLAETSWQATAPGQVLTNTIPGDLRDPDFKCCRKSDGVKYEATASVFATGGLEWLVVVGRDITCQPHEIFVFGKCQDCPGGQVPLDDRTCVICAEAFPGTISDEGIDGGTGTQCVCPTGTYAVRDGNVDKCQPCSMLPSKVVGVREEIADPIAWEGEAVCPGGVSWHTRICPLHKLWVEIEERQSDASGEITEVTLFTCPACVSGPCVNSSYLDTQSSSLQTTIGGVGLQPNAVCREHHTGFLCADCESNYKTVEGECVPCESTDWTWVVTEGFSAILIGLFLLSKTWHSVCKPTDADNVFQLMDTAKDGFLSGNEIRTLLVRMGNPVAASSNFENVLADMKAKDIWNSQKCGSMRVHLPRWCGGISPPDKGWVLRDSVSRHEFHDWCAANQNRATVGMYVFAVQTFALVTAKTSDFSILELFNMDVSNAIKSCRMPNCGLLCGIAVRVCLLQ